MAAVPRRRKVIGHRRRVEDEGEDEAGRGGLDIDDDSLTEGTIGSDDNDPADDSDTSNVDEVSPTSLNARKASGNGAAKASERHHTSKLDVPSAEPSQPSVSDTDIMLNGLSISDEAGPVQEISFDDMVDSPAKSASAPIIVSSSSAPNPQDPPLERRRREHEEYRRKRDEDPAFVPNRGAFFMHDHRHAGPAGNGFRPFPRGRGRGRGGFGGHFAPVNQFHTPSDPTTSAPWAHDMHEIVADPTPPRLPRHIGSHNEGIANGDGHIPTCPPSATPINRTLSTEKLLGNVQVRVFFPPMEKPIVFPGVPVKQYTKLPDHRPPLRRDKPVRISLPDRAPRYIFPAVDRSFIFIPRAMRPNQQRLRGKPRSGLGSISGFSRRTSIYGGSYYGSVYSPSIAMSRRSSIAPDMARDFLISPTGSAVSRPPLPVDTTRPIVRLPPMARPEQPAPVFNPSQGFDGAPLPGAQMAVGEPSISEIPPPQTHPLPQKPTFQENRPNSIPMHQPRPQKAVSLAGIESPTMSMNISQPYQQAFHQQVPVQMANGFSQDSHTRNTSFSQVSTGTPLSQIPERAIHAAPFQPNAYQQQQQQQQPPQQGFYGQPYQMAQPQQGYFYPPPPFGGSMPPSATAPAFVPGPPQGPPTNYPQPSQGDAPSAQQNGQALPGPNLVAQEVNGMVYYYDAAQLPAVTGYPSYSGPPGYVPGVVGMGGMVTPSPDAFYYPQPAQGVVYYPQ
ncbi:Titin [Pleurostoma richardsiae]|uniref:Titin n=1 Tax=Pleurostoma richardsiae TaxID=41990 RepID=A0AA38VZG1_9PEZI|nr:Titin [Pleurostoma richardsiae]